VDSWFFSERYGGGVDRLFLGSYVKIQVLMQLMCLASSIKSMVNLLAYVLFRGTFLLERGEMGRKISHISLVLVDYKL
jgi:hypothetical protein